MSKKSSQVHKRRTHTREQIIRLAMQVLTLIVLLFAADVGAQSPSTSPNDSSSCAVCGAGMVISNPKGIVNVPDTAPITCEYYGHIGLTGYFDPTGCAIASVYATECGCVPSDQGNTSVLSFPPCEICGKGRKVSKLDEILYATDGTPITCELLDRVGKKGVFDPQTCALVPESTRIPCGCVSKLKRVQIVVIVLSLMSIVVIFVFMARSWIPNFCHNYNTPGDQSFNSEIQSTSRGDSLPDELDIKRMNNAATNLIPESIYVVKKTMKERTTSRASTEFLGILQQPTRPLTLELGVCLPETESEGPSTTDGCAPSRGSPGVVIDSGKE
eukprot:CAMPEP_0116833016 /NCGR_PEP_ID=MMETSP0418-20121206/6206_1 /TAXON_ID=1158023 /ORGANISM="Astrosyne radiata, Strain 13vi08-1A" /LENGTH=328 /DNA_ID=CAMNT_0004462427 /DNA_START=86 /DNA_END=1072 /DNA_ORIENTATION=-